MKRALERIQTGEYARGFILENRAGAPDAAGPPPRDGRARDRKGRREAARDDAVIKANRLVDARATDRGAAARSGDALSRA